MGVGSVAEGCATSGRALPSGTVGQDVVGLGPSWACNAPSWTLH